MGDGTASISTNEVLKEAMTDFDEDVGESAVTPAL